LALSASTPQVCPCGATNTASGKQAAASSAKRSASFPVFQARANASITSAVVMKPSLPAAACRWQGLRSPGSEFSSRLLGADGAQVGVAGQMAPGGQVNGCGRVRGDQVNYCALRGDCSCWSASGRLDGVNALDGARLQPFRFGDVESGGLDE